MGPNSHAVCVVGGIAVVRQYSDAFKGTAQYYSRFRPGYPGGFFAFLKREFKLDRLGHLLDLGCGTGQIALPLAGDFHKVIAMDPESEMLDEGRRMALEAGVTNVDFVLGSSADLPDLQGQLGMFRLVTMGSSFHWMNREATLETLSGMVEPGGGLAVASAGSLWTHNTPWCQEVKSVVQRWLGQERRAGSSTYTVPPIRHETLIDRSPFGPCRTHVFRYRRQWTIEGIIGYLYSTSFCSPLVLGDRRMAFEADVGSSLLSLNPEGLFTEYVRLEVLLGFLCI